MGATFLLALSALSNLLVGCFIINVAITAIVYLKRIKQNQINKVLLLAMIKSSYFRRARS